MITESSAERRSFLRAGAGIVVGVSCLAGVGVRALRNAAAAADRPPLTEGSVQAPAEDWMQVQEGLASAAKYGKKAIFVGQECAKTTGALRLAVKEDDGAVLIIAQAG